MLCIGVAWLMCSVYGVWYSWHCFHTWELRDSATRPAAFSTTWWGGTRAFVRGRYSGRYTYMYSWFSESYFVCPHARFVHGSLLFF